MSRYTESHESVEASACMRAAYSISTGHNLTGNQMNYYAFHIGDYKAHTSHLSLIEDLAFRRMLDLYYLTESPLPDVKKIARAICMRENIEDIQTVLDEFFIDTEEGYIHNRCEREIKAMNDKSGKAKLSALKRWSKTDNANAMPESCEGNANASNNHANASKNDANAMRDGCEGNAPNPNPNPIPNPNNTIGDFDVFWNQYPNKTAKQAAVKAWSKLKPNESLFNLIINALEKQKPHFKVGFIPHPATWINGRRWEDAIPTHVEGQEAKPTNQPKQPEITPPVYKNWSDEPLPPADKKWGMTPEQLERLKKI